MSKKINEVVKENKTNSDIVRILSKLGLTLESTLDELHESINKITNDVEKLEILYKISQYLSQPTSTSVNQPSNTTNKTHTQNASDRFNHPTLTVEELDEVYRRILSTKNDIIRLINRFISNLDYPEKIMRDYIRDKILTSVVIPIEKRQGIYVMSRKFYIGELYHYPEIRELVEEIVDDIMFQNYFGDDLESL